MECRIINTCQSLRSLVSLTCLTHVNDKILSDGDTENHRDERWKFFSLWTKTKQSAPPAFGTGGAAPNAIDFFITLGSGHFSIPMST